MSKRKQSSVDVLIKAAQEYPHQPGIIDGEPSAKGLFTGLKGKWAISSRSTNKKDGVIFIFSDLSLVIFLGIIFWASFANGEINLYILPPGLVGGILALLMLIRGIYLLNRG